MEILRVKDLSFTYPQEKCAALKDVCFSIAEGEFCVLCGPSGCGKTTLLRLLKKELAPKGSLRGEIFYCGRSLDELSEREAAEEIGYVSQDPEQQIVTDRVWHELAFGLENLGLSRESIRRRVGEVAGFFGIERWFRQETSTLSGGQKQLLNLASVMVMRPRILLLDEPTSQLDPIAAADFLAMLARLHRELGLTILFVEHRLEECLSLCDTIGVMSEGKLVCMDAPAKVGAKMADGALPLLPEAIRRLRLSFPSAARLYWSLAKNSSASCPLSVREGRQFLKNICPNPKVRTLPSGEEIKGSPALTLKNVWFRYEKTSPDILCGADFLLQEGEVYCLLGGNGSGKTTLLHVAAGLRRAYRGDVRIFGKKQAAYRSNSLYQGVLSYLPQDVRTIFAKDSVREDFEEYFNVCSLSKKEWETRTNDLWKKLEIPDILDRHPYDLSGGEQQKCALTKLLVANPRILLLDEPTKGLDAYAKQALGGVLQKHCKDGASVLIVTHDLEFAAQFANRCGLFFDGGILAQAAPQEFFGENRFYTTSAKRISEGLFLGTITCEQVEALCRVNKEEVV